MFRFRRDGGSGSSRNDFFSSFRFRYKCKVRDVGWKSEEKSENKENDVGEDVGCVVNICEYVGTKDGSRRPVREWRKLS